MTVGAVMDDPFFLTPPFVLNSKQVKLIHRELQSPKLPVFRKISVKIDGSFMQDFELFIDYNCFQLWIKSNE